MCGGKLFKEHPKSIQGMIPKKPAPDLIRGGYRFPAFANRLRPKADFGSQEPLRRAKEGRIRSCSNTKLEPGSDSIKADKALMRGLNKKY
jgi:hypothetical protein